MEVLQDSYKETKVGRIPKDWEVVRLGEVSTLMTNGFVGTATPYYTEDENGVIYLQGFNVRENRLRLTGVKKVTEEFSKKQSKSILKAEDILTVQSGHIGTTAKVPKELEGANCHALIITRLKQDKIDSDFISYYLNSGTGSSRLNGLKVGSTILHINVKDFKKFRIPLPPLPEQQKIAEILSTVDEQISATERIIEKSKELKKGLMQKLFSEGIGHTEFKESKIGRIPKDWEVTKLQSIANIIMGQSPSSSSYNEDEIGLPLVQGNADIKNRKTTPRIFTSQITKESEENDIIMTVRAPVGAIAKATLKTCIGRGVCAIRPNRVDSEYLYQKLVSLESSWRRLEQGSTFSAVNSKDVKTLNIPLPPLAEQKKIAEFLSQADKKIEKEEQYKWELEQLKKGLMQQLLTGQKRVKV